MLRATLQTVQASTASRRYATSALASPQIQVSQAGQGVRVATARSEASPAASVSLVVKAGSRYESADNAGVAHFLKNFAFKNTQNRTGFRIIRESELQGGILTASIDREHLVYTARCLQDDVPYFAGLLAAVAFETRYTAYEFVDLKAQVASETLAAQADSNIKLFDELHRVAFNRGLGNSLYASPYNQITHQKLCNYASQAFQGSQMSLVGVNVHHNQLADLANQLFAQAPATLALQGAPAQYVGGEALIDGPASQTQYVLAYPTAGRSDLKQAAAHQVLGH
ncbi:ubiquinol-cytochrome c reductase core subunit 1, partial [Dimargaris verticillata]